MFLVRYYLNWKVEPKSMLRLMSLKCNPWLSSDDAESEHNSDIHKNDLFIFSGENEGVPENDRKHTGDY